MRKIEKDELKTILKKHMMWLNGEDGGEKADLSGCDINGGDMSEVNLRWADLSGCDMRGANLSGCDMSEVNLRWADLSGCDLRGCDMSEVNLRWADLSGCDLRGADLSGCDMSGADLSGCDMSGAKHIDSTKNLFYPLSCPEVGEYIGFKKADGKIVELRIPANAKRSSATGRKCRANKAVVVKITELDGTPAGDEACSDFDSSFVYRVGETVEVQNFDENRWNECAPGIHHYITREEAVRH